MVTWIWLNIGSGNGLLPDGTKPLPEPKLIHHQFTWPGVEYVFVFDSFQAAYLNYIGIRAYLCLIENGVLYLYIGLKVYLTPALIISEVQWN